MKKLLLLIALPLLLAACGAFSGALSDADVARYIKACDNFSDLDKAGAFAVKLAEKLLKDGDIDVVARHIDAISAALSNEKLPADLRHSSGGFDD